VEEDDVEEDDDGYNYDYDEGTPPR